jgi:tellurite resistance-related uncharacterized protein
MKYLIGIVVVILVLFGLYLAFGKTITTTTVVKTENSTTPLSLVMVSAIKKTVNLYKTSDSKTEVIDSELAYEGNTVETLSSGRALLQTENGTLTTLDYSSKLVIQTHSDDQHSSFHLSLGKVWSTVEKVFGKGEYYEIETQNAVAVVRGTSFGVSYDGKFTTLEVTEGAVLFVPIDKDGNRLYDKAVLVPAGKKAVVGDDGIIKISDLTDSEKKLEWFIYNNGDTSGATTQFQDAASQVRISDLLIKSRSTPTSP